MMDLQLLSLFIAGFIITLVLIQNGSKMGPKIYRLQRKMTVKGHSSI